MYKETCKTTKFIDFKIKKYDNSVSFLTHSDYCLMGNTNVCCPIPWDYHRNDIPMDKPAYLVLSDGHFSYLIVYLSLWVPIYV